MNYNNQHRRPSSPTSLGFEGRGAWRRVGELARRAGGRERRGTWCSSPLRAAWATSGLVGCEGSTLAGEARAEGRKAELEEGKKISKDGGPPLPSRVIPVTNPAAFQCLLHYRTDIRTLSSRSLSIHFPLGVSQTRRKPYTLSRIIYNSGTLARFVAAGYAARAEIC
jgi:hypothetical protein